MKIEASSLSTCAVVDGGDQITLGIVDANGRDIEIRVSAADACSIAMTLPKLLRNSLQTKYHDPSLRYVFPLDSWNVEAASSGTQVILTFATQGGFEVSFSTNPETCPLLGSALFESTEARIGEGSPPPH